MAAAGYCEDEDDNAYYYFMMADCAPACQRCDTFELIETCTPDAEDNIIEDGDLNRMFRRIVAEGFLKDYEAVVHSAPDHKPVYSSSINGPWVVSLDNFLSDVECDRLIELGDKSNYDASEHEAEELDDRTPINTWCKSKCYEDPVMENIIERMSVVTGIPQANSEYLQMLKYTAGQEYEEYNLYDLSEASYEQMPGPTIVTVYLFLNDVKEGGETHFVDMSGQGANLSLNIKPKKGTALIWPSVHNNPLVLEERTLHEFLPVTKGVKYAVKASFHLRSYDHDDCDYDAFAEFKWW